MSAAVNGLAGLPRLGAVIRSARLRAGWTQTQLGARVGYSAATVSRIEQGKQLLRDIVVIRVFADALGIPLEFVGLADPDQPRPGRAGRSLDAIEQRVAQLEVVAAGAAVQELGDDPGPDEAARSGVQDIRERPAQDALGGAGSQQRGRVQHRDDAAGRRAARVGHVREAQPGAGDVGDVEVAVRGSPRKNADVRTGFQIK